MAAPTADNGGGFACRFINVLPELIFLFWRHFDVIWTDCVIHDHPEKIHDAILDKMISLFWSFYDLEPVLHL